MFSSLLVPMTVAVLGLPVADKVDDAGSHTEVVTVTMVDNRFLPDHLTFQSGQRYELDLENHGKDMHEFTAPAFWKAATVPDKRMLANNGTDVVVQAGQSVHIVLIAPAKGTYNLTCADHDWDGMVGTITVK